jgi:non-heme chloroperoxidase
MGNRETEARHNPGRRNILLGSATAITAYAALSGIASNEAAAAQGQTMGMAPSPATDRVTAKDGAQIFYKDWGSGTPLVFSHGWPLNADAWDEQLFYFASRGFRCIAYDRRGFGRSSQTWAGNDNDTFTDDLAALLDALDVKGATLIGHSAGAGEVVRYVARQTGRIAKTVLASAIPPLMLKTAGNPGGVPIEVFDGIRTALRTDRSQFYRDLSGPFYGANRPGSKVSQGVKDALWMWSMQAGQKAAYDGIKAFSETDFTEDLKRINTPTLILHGEDDQNVPLANSALKSAKLIRNAVLKVYPGAPHGLMVTHRDQFHSDLLAFVTGQGVPGSQAAAERT